ncbi:MAG: HAD family hydrolase [Micromonosporaceae bacterium]
MPQTPFRRRVDAVLFDFHGTLAQLEPPLNWVRHAAASCGVELDPERAAALAKELTVVGREGGPPRGHLPPELARAYADRDLSEADHRAAYLGFFRTVDTGIDGLPEALYARILDPAGWVVYPDAVPTLRELRERGIPAAVVSNIGFDVRPVGKLAGFTELIDIWVLSYELGVCKPDPAIFRHACAELGVDPTRALMVGDTAADAGAARAGCSALVLPISPAGQPHGLGAVLGLI